MPNAIPAGAESSLPPARMIDPRGHRFGAGLSAILLIASFAAGWVPGVFLALLSIGTSAAFGLKYSIYGAIWRRIVRIARLGKAEPEHEYPPRFAQTLGSIALILSLLAFAVGWSTLGWAFALAVAALQGAPRADGLLPGLPAVLPALVGSVGRDVDLDARPRDEVRGSVRGFVLLALSATVTTRSGPRSGTARSRAPRPPRPAGPGARSGTRGGSRWRPRRASR